MPRGPGKKENYNFDYSRFNGCDAEQEVEIHRKAEVEDPTDPGNVFRQLPGELQEAFRLMQLSKETGDVKAQARANELALKAVERGGPEMKQRFQKEVMKQAAQNPDAKQALEEVINGCAPRSRPEQSSADQVEELSSTINRLQKQMKEGAANTERHVEALKQQQDLLENMQGPEDFARFLHENGLTEKDMQRVLSGDEAFMKQAFDKAIGKLETPELQKTMKNADAMMDAVDTLHTQLSDEPDKIAIPSLPKAEVAHVSSAPQPVVPEPKIPEHRVQYTKDADGNLQSVQLRCELPGIQAMSDIDLHLSEKYLRLSTQSPAYVVNAGPFPALVDDKAARAKFSKKRQELTLTVPAKP